MTQDELGYEANGLETIDWADAKQGLHNLEKEYPNCLDWFTVDLDGEHSAMDGRILEEHTEYVVQAIHRVRRQCSRCSFIRALCGNINSLKPVS